MKQLAEWTADAEPFGRAEQYGEHEQQEAQTVTTVGWIVFADAGDARTPEPNARGIASRIFFHNGSGSRSSSGWTLVSPSWVDPLSLDLRGLVLLEDAVRAISGLILLVRGCMVGDDTVTIWSIDESRQPIRRVRLSRFPAGARICLIMGCMTPAERASAVAFALKNCALETMTPGEATMRAAAAYERGLKPVTHLIDVADEQTAMRLRAAADPAGKDRLAAGSLDDHATDRADAVFARTVLLAERRWNPSGDLDELTAIHKGLFEGVFEDAGKLRTSNTTREVTNDRARAANPEAFFPAGSLRPARTTSRWSWRTSATCMRWIATCSFTRSLLFMMSSVICIRSVAAMRWCCVYSVHAWRMTPAGISTGAQ